VNPRLLALHARARHVPAIAASLGVLAAATWALGNQLAHESGQVDPANRMRVTVMASLVAAILISTALTGADDELELSTRAHWARLRSALLVAMTVLASTLLALTGSWAPEQFGAHALVRDIVGEVGLVALCAAVVGVRASWVPALGITIVALWRGPADAGAVATMLTWQVQPTDVRAAGITALALGVAGLGIYARRGSRPSTP
jgi:hypothetical protein